MAQILTGKVALVTGGSRGIGAATARALAEEGADVAISYTASYITGAMLTVDGGLRHRRPGQAEKQGDGVR